MSAIKTKLKENHALVCIYGSTFRTLTRALTLISPEVNTKFMYHHDFHKKLDLKNPKKFNEKLLWLKLNKYMTNELVIQCADKYRVRQYVEDCGCGDILNELYFAVDNAEDINWEQLPDKFALKWNFGAGYNVICDDKSKLDKKKTVKKMKKWGKRRPWLTHSEMQYKYIPKKIICERYLQDSTNRLPEDFKVYCFNGKPTYTMICEGREHGKPKFYFFDRNWKLARVNKDSINAPQGFTLPKPECFDKLMQYAEKLSAPFEFVRSDFYIINGKLVFGELTFTPAGSMDSNIPVKMDEDFGELIKLNK